MRIIFSIFLIIPSFAYSQNAIQKQIDSANKLVKAAVESINNATTLLTASAKGEVANSNNPFGDLVLIEQGFVEAEADNIIGEVQNQNGKLVLIDKKTKEVLGEVTVDKGEVKIADHSQQNVEIGKRSRIQIDSVRLYIKGKNVTNVTVYIAGQPYPLDLSVSLDSINTCDSLIKVRYSDEEYNIQINKFLRLIKSDTSVSILDQEIKLYDDGKQVSVKIK